MTVFVTAEPFCFFLHFYPRNVKKGNTKFNLFLIKVRFFLLTLRCATFSVKFPDKSFITWKQIYKFAEYIMRDFKIKVILLDEALNFIRSLQLKVQEKIVYNYKKIENGLIDKELFKKLDNSEIWELRTLYNGNCYRLFSFWDTDAETYVIATHGIVKKSQKTPVKEIEKAEAIRKEYFKNQ